MTLTISPNFNPSQSELINLSVRLTLQLHYTVSKLTTAGEVHRMRDGIVPVDAESHQDIGRCVGDAGLGETDCLASDVPGLPGYRHPPNNIRQHAEQTHA